MPKRIQLKQQTWSYWLLALLSLAGYAVMGVAAPLIPFVKRLALADIRTFAPWPWRMLAYAALLCLLFGLYWQAYRWVERRPRPPALAAILLPALLFGLPLLLTFPFNATDVFRYWLNGRIMVVYGQSPYHILPNQLLDDPLMRLAGEWAKYSSPYGPLWELVSAGLARIAPHDLLLGVILLKALGVLTHLALTCLIWLAMPSASPGTRAGRTLLWAWNPALLLNFVVNAHNDLLMLLWLVLGLVFIRRGRPTAGLIVMLLAPLTKPSGLLPIPFFLIACLRDAASTSARLKLTLTVAAAGLALTWLAFLPFGSPLELMPEVARAANAGGGYSLPVMLALVLPRLGLRVPARLWSLGALTLLALLALWLAWRTWRGRSPLRAAADMNAGYLLLSTKFRIWYASWVFPWLLLDAPADSQADFRLRAGLWFLLTSQLSVLIYGQIRIALLGGEHLWTHLIGVPFTFGLPLLLAALPRRRKQANPG